MDHVLPASARPYRPRLTPLLAVVLGVLLRPVAQLEAVEDLTATVSVSSTAPGTLPRGALDGDRFSIAPDSLWKGAAREASWQITFPEDRKIGAILQVNGDDSLVLQNAPRHYIWQASDDGHTWRSLSETLVRRETRMFRIHRLSTPVVTRHMRLLINLSHGSAPAVREIEFYAEPTAPIPFPDWLVAVSSAEDPNALRIGEPFVRLARICDGWQDVPAQLLWHGDLDPEFVAVEPRPLCAFLSGSFLEWCQRSREPWRGVEQILKARSLPMWGACGGGQILAILEETGVDAPWDCPRCRDPRRPASPVYSHIGHTGPASCGDYRMNVAERGIYHMQIVAQDPVFRGVPEVFGILESHVGQIEYLPEAWIRLVTRGPGAHTVNQCLRVRDAPIYAAQFHMESFDDTTEVSRRIMANFLDVARRWKGGRE